MGLELLGIFFDNRRRRPLTIIYLGFSLCHYFVYCSSWSLNVGIDFTTFTVSGWEVGLELVGIFLDYRAIWVSCP